ncbi:hypothetical protein ABT337_31910 [Saccharopolyspora hirsuta]|nr:hypothetical protein [Saccharopolyspora hirsuta]
MVFREVLQIVALVGGKWSCRPSGSWAAVAAGSASCSAPRPASPSGCSP